MSVCLALPLRLAHSWVWLRPLPRLAWSGIRVGPPPGHPPIPPHPTRDPQPTCAGRAPILNQESVCPRTPLLPPRAGQSWDALRCRRGRRTEPLALWNLGVRDPRARATSQLPLPSSGATGQRAREAIPGATASSRAAGRGGCRAWGLGAPAGVPRGGCRSGGSGRRGPRTERREARSAALGAGRGRGRKLGRTRAGGRGGGAPRRSNPGRAPRAPSRPAGGTEGDFHPDTPQTRPRPRCGAERAAGLGGRGPERLGGCIAEEQGRGWGSRLRDLVPEAGHGEWGAWRGSTAQQDRGPSELPASSVLRALKGPRAGAGQGPR